MKRIVIACDGTWKRIDAPHPTNVARLAQAVLPVAPDGVPQLVCHLDGVGTGQGAGMLTRTLDRALGGAFGQGLMASVAAAYRFLVFTHAPGDEILLFGFSRGAYTARSLVGLLDHCGLLHRGAPLTSIQLWEAYSRIGRVAEGNMGWWERLAGQELPPWRSLRNIERYLRKPAPALPAPLPASILPGDNEEEEEAWRKEWRTRGRDGWQKAWLEQWRTGKTKKEQKEWRKELWKAWRKVAREAADPLTSNEQKLVAASRRVPIAFLGIYDTVGSMGIDALAIPGVRGDLALVHNMDLSPLIATCRHALALDEHRNNFVHTPLRKINPLPYRAVEQDIQQRWFPGAHSNVGGGYPFGDPSLRVLHWMVREATAGAHGMKLTFPFPNASAPLPESARPLFNRLRDSYAEFAPPLWAHILRGKRHYRRVAPPPELRGRHRKAGGESLESMNECVDESVWDLLDACRDDYCPANLVPHENELLRRESETNSAAPPRPARLTTDRCRHQWTAWSGKGLVLLMVWSIIATIGLAGAARLFFPGCALDTISKLTMALIIAATLIFVDWQESRLNFRIARDEPKSPWPQARKDVLYWLRAAGVVLFFCGLLWLLSGLISLVCTGTADGPGFPYTAFTIIGAVAGMAGTSLGEKLWNGKWLGGTGGFPWPLFNALAPLAAVLGFLWIARPSLSEFVNFKEATGDGKKLAGALLLLVLFMAYHADALLNWTGERMKQAHLDGILKLQLAWSPTRVRNVLRMWTGRITPGWQRGGGDGWKAYRKQMGDIVRGSLARDTLGYIPLYMAFLGFGLWFAVEHASWRWLDSALPGLLPLHLWWIVPVLVGVFDLLENCCHRGYLKAFEQDAAAVWKPARWRHFGCQALVVLKFTGFLPALFLIYGAMLQETWKLLTHTPESGWRGALAVAAVALMLSTGILWLIACARGWFNKHSGWHERRARHNEWITERE